MNRILQSFFIFFIFSKREFVVYFECFQFFQYFSEWFRIQNSIYYIWFWFLSEIERAFFFISLILRIHVRINWFRWSFIQVAREILFENESTLKIITKVFETITVFNTLIKNQRYINSNIFHQIILKNKRIYQNLIQCAIRVEKNFVRQINEVAKNDDEMTILTNIFKNVDNFDFDSKNELIKLKSFNRNNKNKEKIKIKIDKKFKKKIVQISIR